MVGISYQLCSVFSYTNIFHLHFRLLENLVEVTILLIQDAIEIVVLFYLVLYLQGNLLLLLCCLFSTLLEGAFGDIPVFVFLICSMFDSLVVFVTDHHLKQKKQLKNNNNQLNDLENQLIWSRENDLNLFYSELFL